ncbi:MAG TPA: hypothetical protein QGF02_04525 [Candidatus Babeliales bacterium]|nr:hypothetical protein [Candidatus Babeliales bacterium]
MNLLSISKTILISLICTTVYGLEVTVTKKQATAMPIALVTVKPVTNELKSVANFVAQDLGVNNQFDIAMSSIQTLKQTKQITKFAQELKALAVFLSSPDSDSIEWRLYNTMTGQMVDGKLVKQEGRSVVQWSHIIADQIWPLLTSEQGSFSSVIAACKRGVHKKNNKKFSHIYAFGPVVGADKTKKVVVQGERINFAPRWHPKRGQLFYSQHCPFNISLVSVSPGKTPRTIMGFEGQNMTPAVSQKGRVVISLSNRADAHLYEYRFDPITKKGQFVLLTKGTGQYISPTFRGEDQIVFCYINKRGRPAIGSLDLKTKNISWITKEHGVSPCVSPDSSKLAYSSRKDNMLQLCTYDFKTKETRQVTHDRLGHKDESSWSPCGNYLACSVEKSAQSRIACFHLPTKSCRFLTPADEYWSFPAWSPHFEKQIPFL